ncbi:MAG: polyprenol monophosphomannose synthase [Muribaculaceae bacterium]|nr:polyprenol monophosphomannose synthase [Muribaculaceae bacterium]
MHTADKSVCDTLVIIPTYNEKENIAAIIDAVMELDGNLFDVLVVDDNSPDGTADIVKERMTVYPDRVHILERSGKLGLGTAYIAGFKWALQRHYAYICEMDADFSHDPKDLLRLRQAVAEHIGDVAVGSRYVSGVNVVNWPIGRVLMSYFASAYVRLITGMKVHDTTAGFVCYSRDVLENMDLDEIRFKGYAFQIEMKFTAYQKKYRVVEIPIVFVNRRLGTSKMSSGIFEEAFFGVIRLRWNSLFKKQKSVPKQ